MTTQLQERVLLVESGREYTSPVRRGLVRIRDGRCYLAAPAWGHFVGLTTTEVIDRCMINGYRYEWQDVDTAQAGE